MADQKKYERLTDIFHDVFDDDDIVLSPGMTAEDVDDWDSLSHIRLIVAVEKEFDITFTSSEVTELENVEQFADLVQSKLAS
jgi:acyl carrier protein